ncbi:hypothetical protein BC943DRAFT_316361 [Umbelopsis sp. AD052]|nr:hypothetical protein BC943DRAFT_316361 [Umbelopsis sp. AD052]
MLDPQDHNDFFADEDSDREASVSSQKNYTSHDLEKELRDILGDEYDDGANADADEGETGQTQARRPPTNLAEQKDELMRYIAQKEARISALKEELAAQEEELTLLKDTWTRVMTPTRSPDRMERTGSPLPLSPTKGPSSPKEDYLAQASKAAYENLSKSVFSIFSSTQKALESENFQQTKNRAMSLSKEAMENVQVRLKTVTDSDSFQSRKQSALQAVETMVSKTADVIDRQMSLLESSLEDPQARRPNRNNTVGNAGPQSPQSP